MKRIFLSTVLFLSLPAYALEHRVAQKSLEKIYTQMLSKNFSKQQSTHALLLASACLRHSLGHEKAASLIKEARTNILDTEEKVFKYLDAFKNAPITWKMPRKEELISVCEGVLQ